MFMLNAGLVNPSREDKASHPAQRAQMRKGIGPKESMMVIMDPNPVLTEDELLDKIEEEDEKYFAEEAEYFSSREDMGFPDTQVIDEIPWDYEEDDFD